MNSPSQLCLLYEDRVQGRTRKSDPRTSVEAARTCQANRQRDVLLRELGAVLHGCTCDELESRTGIPRYIVSSRLAQMRRDGLVEPFATRENQHGRQVQVWFLRCSPRVVTVETNGRL